METPPAAPRPTPQPVLSAFRTHETAKQPAPGRRLRLFIILTAISTIIILGFVAVTLFMDAPRDDSPWPVADQFLEWLKLGEEVDASHGDGDRVGYALAYGLFTEDLQAEQPWIDFLQNWARLTRQHGYIMSSRRATQRRHRRGDRHKRRFMYDLFLGSETGSHEDMTRLRLRFDLVRVDDTYRVKAYELVPMGPHER